MARHFLGLAAAAAMGVKTTFFNSVHASTSPLANAAQSQWGPGIKWCSLEQGSRRAGKEDRPMMVIVHDREDQASKDLATSVYRCHELERLARHFVMITLETNDIPKGKKALPIGNETPQVLFFKPNGMLMSDITSDKRGDKKFVYTASTLPVILHNMKEVLKVNHIDMHSPPTRHHLDYTPAKPVKSNKKKF